MSCPIEKRQHHRTRLPPTATRSIDRSERRRDPPRRPPSWFTRPVTGFGDVGAEPGSKDDSPIAAGDLDEASTDEHAEYVIAGAGEEHSAAYRDQGERRAHLQVLAFCIVVTIDHHRALLKVKRAADIDHELVDADLSQRAKFHERGLAEMHDKSRIGFGLNEIADETLGGWLQRASRFRPFGEGIAVHRFNLTRRGLLGFD